MLSFCYLTCPIIIPTSVVTQSFLLFIHSQTFTFVLSYPVLASPAVESHGMWLPVYINSILIAFLVELVRAATSDLYCFLTDSQYQLSLQGIRLDLLQMIQLKEMQQDFSELIL